MAWAIKKVIGNIAITAWHLLTELEVKNQRIMYLERQLEITKEHRVRNRTRITTDGTAWVDRDDIQYFFAEQVQGQQRTVEQRHQNLINLIAGRKERLQECQQKRKDAEILEGEGCLLKRRKTGSQLKEKESWLRQQIHEAETRLRSLELHIGDLQSKNAERAVDRNAWDFKGSTSSVGGIHEGTHIMLEDDPDWDRNEVNTTPTPAPYDVLI
ncbi:hypothetical protein B9Z19DRAFT_1063797 [Tuber borchii]|uniref:Uncharacterized protein n=1 Tax=Tuber borchii TaxID=42251 RepID=A0A2T6ZWY3_TUBBO|nr:hypothetical protein B9Z19DRAFT_1063797 [Tuber borchii]